jgi:flavorubredoxin
MRAFITHLTERGYQNRTVAFMENGSWAPTAKRVMAGLLEKSKNITYCENSVTLKSALNADSRASIAALVNELVKK